MSSRRKKKLLPSSVCVMGQEWSVEIKPLDENTLGETFAADKKILIDPDLSEDEKERVLLHEVLHAALFMAGLAQTSAPLLDNAIEETIVTALEHALFPLYKRRT